MLQMVGDWRQEDWRELLSFGITHQMRNLSVDTSQVARLLPSFPVRPMRVSHPGPILGLVQTRPESASLRHSQKSATFPCLPELLLLARVESPAISHSEANFFAQRHY
jgi:hypothetical protein